MTDNPHAAQRSDPDHEPDYRRPLTDAQIDSLIAPWWNSAAIAEVLASDHPAARDAGASILRQVARVVERAHGIETLNDVHTCSYYCERPACVRAQRDELRDRFVALATTGNQCV